MKQMQTHDAAIEIPILPLKDLTLLIREVVEGTFSRVRVRAEVSSLKRHTSGHTYFCLKDDEAVLDAVCWRGTPQALLEDGLEIIATGRITVYGARSKYQMIVESFEPAGEGALLKLLLERKNRLAAEGLFDADRKKPLPRLPQCIGIVTSPTGAVIQDILHRLRDRHACHVLIWPVAVQGQGAAEAIAAAITGFQSLPQKPDVLIVARGGGSLEDLWAFNEEIVVRAVSASEIPLISAVGHETDTTLIDFAADVRAPTPTAAAEIATPLLLTDLWLWMSERQQRLTSILSQTIERYQLRLNAIQPQRLDPRRLLEEKTQRLDEWSERWVKACASSLERWQQPVKMLGDRLEQASYKKVLERGFAWVTTLTGQTIASSQKVKPLQRLRLTFADGTVAAKVEPAKREGGVMAPSQPRLF
jgi:exodeoxyribonuclease VII large subunit